MSPNNAEEWMKTIQGGQQYILGLKILLPDNGTVKEVPVLKLQQKCGCIGLLLSLEGCHIY